MTKDHKNEPYAFSLPACLLLIQASGTSHATRLLRPLLLQVAFVFFSPSSIFLHCGDGDGGERQNGLMQTFMRIISE